jgi:hypothetical protein
MSKDAPEFLLDSDGDVWRRKYPWSSAGPDVFYVCIQEGEHASAVSARELFEHYAPLTVLERGDEFRPSTCDTEPHGGQG